jgi:UDP-N-acetylmuramyl pentapeptide phosphotransferase/UDP-N-acetylglucosamine-1-phosphate transferase
VPLDSPVAIGFSILIIPLLDTLRVFALRIFNGRSPFTPDKNHIHHLLLGWGLGHTAVTLVCVMLNIGFVVLAYMSRNLGSTYVLAIMLVLAFTGFAFLYYRRPKRTLIIAKRMDGTGELKATSKVVTLAPEAATADNS